MNIDADARLPRIASIQVGRSRRVRIGERLVPTAIFKSSVSAQVAVGTLGLEGDEQADLTVHGGVQKAIYAYPAEHYDFWRAERERAGISPIDNGLVHGALGENLTLLGLLETEVWINDVLRFANCVLRVTEPREPCFKFNAAMGFSRAAKAMAETGFCGFYLAVETPGTLCSGEGFELVSGPRSVSVAERFAERMGRTR
jgi:MOSC domain-containing protein YiiM